MGRGIAGVIPVIFSVSTQGSKSNFGKILPSMKDKMLELRPNCLKHYKLVETTDLGDEIYHMDEKFLIENLKGFLVEFHEKMNRPFLGEYKDFIEKFDHTISEGATLEILYEYITDVCKGYIDYISVERDNHFNAKPAYINPIDLISFYDGGYKVLMEDERILHDFENLITNSFENPLAQTISICMYG
jgi:hypothetical protein